MKTLRSASSLLFLAALFAAGTPPAAAQDPAQVAPDAYKCTFENDRVRVCEVTVKPGGKIPTHSHPDHFAYVLAPGKLKITKADGTATDANFETGAVIWILAETHRGENIGATEIKVLVVELKEPPATAGAHAHH
jgi:quercetin dioxygenase-like cupin family protein